MNARIVPLEMPFEVLALVTSAGGLEAMSAVLADLPAQLGVAVIVGQHLGIESALPEILQRRVTLPVRWAVDGERIAPGVIHIVPPHMRMEVLPDRTCALSRFTHERVLAERPLDGLLHSVAGSYGARSMAVVLTGLGRDGAAGARAVKAAGGAVLVQSEETAAYPDMPRAAVELGAADLVLPLSGLGRAAAELLAGGRFPQPRNELEARDALFAGAGEAREALRAVDWSLTPLGPVQQWSRNLRAILGMALHSRFPTCLFWGEDFIQLYNDAWISLLGSTHPVAAGAPARVSWAESWPYQVEAYRSVLHTGQAGYAADQQFQTNRHGFREEAYFTISRSPLQDDAGHVQGVLAIASETTERVLAHRRLRAMRGLAAARSGAESEAVTAERVLQVLGENPRDVPFALLYGADAAGLRGTLRAAVGLAAGSAFAPHVVDILTVAGTWPLGKVMRQGEPLVLNDLDSRLRAFHAGPWPEPPRCAMLLPLRDGDTTVRGVLVLGLSPRLSLDDPYREFLHLVAKEVGTALAEARLRQHERERLEQLAELDRVKTEFFSNVSHEFRTPLTLILAPLEDMLGGQHPVAEPLRREVEVASRNATRLLHLVDNLLDFSQIQAGRLRARFHPTELAALTAGVAELFRPAFERAGLDYLVDCPPLAQPVALDAAMWEKIVSNLLSNALKFTFHGGVKVRLRELPQHVELAVTDSGVGIPEEQLPLVFGRFHRVRGTRARSQEGAGIGLAMVRELVELHNGRVRARSRPGEGCTFTVWLPRETRVLRAPASPDRRVVAGAVAQQLAQEAVRWTEPGAPAPPGDVLESNVEAGVAGHLVHVPEARLLVVDDNGDMRDYLARTLGAQWNVVLAADGAAALEEARREPPDLVLTDVMMPRLDGFELLHALRSDPRLKSTPVVLLTARAHEESAIEGLLAGADDYIAKPFSSRELVARISAQLELSRVRRQGERQVRELLALMPVGVYACELSGNFSYFNRHAAELWGAEPALDDHGWALRGAPRVLQADGDWLDLQDAPMAQALRTGEPVHDRELTVLRADGGRLELLVNIRPLRQDERVVGAVCAFVDVTARKQAERGLHALNEELEHRVAERTADLQASEARLASELEGAHLLQSLSSQLISGQEAGTLHERMLEAAMQLVQSDAAALQLVDRTGQELVRVASFNFHPLTAAYWDRMGADHATPCAEALREAGRVVVDDVETAPRLAGTQDLLEFRRSGLRSAQSTPLVTRTGRPIGLVSTQWAEPGRATRQDYRLFDVLARQLADLLERSEVETALRASEARYRMLFDSIDEGFVIARVMRDADGRAVDALYLEGNPAAARLTGLPHFDGRLLNDAIPGQEPYWLETCDRVARTGTAERLERFAAPLGRWYDFRVSRFDDGASAGMEPRLAVVFQDITGRKRAEEELRASEERQAFLLKLSDRLREETHPRAIGEAAVRLLAERLHLDRAYVAEVDKARDLAAVGAEYRRPDLAPVEGVVTLSDFPRAWARVKSATLVLADTASDPTLAKEDKEGFAALRMGALVLASARRGTHNPVWALLVASEQPRQWTAAEVALVEETAERTWAAVERARVAVTAARAERRAEAILEHMGDAHCVLDREFHIVSVNAATERLLGRPRETLLGRSHWEVFPESVDAPVGRVIQRVIAERIEQHLTHHYTGEGYDLHLELDAYPTDEGGLAMFWRDITGRVHAGDALRASEEKYRALFNEMDEAYAVVEVLRDAGGRWNDFRFLDVNAAFMRHTGMPYPVGRTATELLGTPNPHWAQLYGRAVDTGEPVRLEEGELTLGRIFDLNIFRLGGEGSHRVAVLFADITERKRAEAALREREERTRWQNQALQAVVDGRPVADALHVLARMVEAETGGEARTAFYLAEPDGATLHPVRGAGTMPDVQLVPVEAFLIGKESGQGPRGCWSFPIETRKGKAAGLFAMYPPQPREATPRELSLAEAVTQTAAVVIVNHEGLATAPPRRAVR